MKQPSKGAVTRGIYVLRAGVWHKRCTGPAHSSPVYLPWTTKYFVRRQTGARKGEFLNRCRLCDNWQRVKMLDADRGFIDIDSVLPFYREAVERIGRAELSRRTGLSIEGLSAILAGKRTRVRRATFRLVLLELISMRRKNEYNGDTPYLRLQEKKRARKRRAKLYARKDKLTLGIPEEHLAIVFPVKDTTPDKMWWHDTGQEWLPRWGEEMLGRDF